jgi:hypothetical protein
MDAQTFGKDLTRLNLRHVDGKVSYTALVTPAELWLRVGELLKEARDRKGWRYPYDVEKHGGPSGPTVQQHEQGDIKTLDALNRHAEILGLNVVDLLSSALEQSKKPLSPEAARVLRAFERTTSRGRRALFEMAEVLDPQPGGQEPPDRNQ